MIGTAKNTKWLYLRAQTELSALLGILKHKTSATMRLQLVLGPEKIILRSRIDFLGKNRRIFLSNFMNSAPKILENP